MKTSVIGIAATASRAGRPLALALCCAALLGCTRRLELEPCNIAERECQEDVYYAVVRMRGDGWDPFDGVPPIRTIDLEQYRDELTPDEPPPAQPQQPPPKATVDPWDVALRWLGLVTPSMPSSQEAIEDRIDHVAAYYSSRSQSVTVIDRGQERDDYADTGLLVHELVHAFQDNEVNGAPVDHTTDGGFAGSALIEGEAVLYERLAYAELDRVSPRSVDWEGYFAGWIDGRRAAVPGQRSPFYAVSWFVYPLGGDLMMSAWLQGGNAAVRKLGSSFPRSGVGFMARHEDIALHGPERLGCELQAPSEQFAIRGFDRFGAMQLYAFLAGNEMHEPDAWRTALAWRDDRLWLFFEEDSEQVALSWRIRLSSEAAADEVVAVASQLPMLRAERRGRDAVIVGSDSELADWPGALDCDRAAR